MTPKRLPSVALAKEGLGTLLVSLAAAATFASGLVSLWSVAGRSVPARAAFLRSVLPVEFLHLSRLLTLLVGFALVIASINIYKRKERAFHVVVILSVLSVIFHLVKGLDYEEAMSSAILLSLLIAARREFVVKSGPPDWPATLFGLAIAALIAIGYGVAGFWLLDARDFGIDFSWHDAAARTFYVLTLRDPGVSPKTGHAVWFLHSLELITATAVLYAGYALFRPSLYRLHTVPAERASAQTIVERHGRTALDFYKLWPDKSLFFSASRRAFLAYQVAGGVAVVLGDSVGPSDELESLIEEFVDFCNENDWRVTLYQTLPDFLPVYEHAGFRELKIGDDAIVDLQRFTLTGPERKGLRSAIRKIEAAGVHIAWYEPPIPAPVMAELRAVSNAWLEIPGRRERRFSVGRFDAAYIRSTPVIAATEGDGRILAFANVVRSYHHAEATIDLMRRRPTAPNGIMDYLFVKLFEHSVQAGYERFNMGLVPMAGFTEQEHASPEARAVHALVRQLDFVFSYKGQKMFKGKFATLWEPRYVVYRHVFDLPRLAYALSRVSED